MGKEKNQAPLFILFEGIDGSGKTTQADMLARHLESMSFRVTRLAEPTQGEWGRKIRGMLKGGIAPDPEEQLRLFLMDRQDDVESNLNPAFQRGDIVVMDRYYYSNAAYQGAAGIDPQLIIDENRKRNFPEPDRIYFIDIPADVAMKRIMLRSGGKNFELFEKKAFLESVREIFLSILKSRAVIIDGSKREDVIFGEIMEDFRIFAASRT
ncbi:MAG TPA: dTMP kinase [Spirochaetota bacterium]|nr:dTMP kinase [Spirochaetota bacterium]HPI90511.1 dTMP kinase [Spirochaetota bacterium]HPR46951.1 dTMP kinase [Spirochaetota bacterium]